MRVLGVLAASALLLGTASLPGNGPAAPGANRRACGTTVGADFNGDGYPDLAVGDPNARFLGHDHGSVHLLRGTAQGFPHVNAADSLITAGRPAALRLTDVDGDGCADLVVGSPHHHNLKRDRVRVYWGARDAKPAFAHETTGLAGTSKEPNDSTDPAWTGLGWSVAAAKGVIAVGAPFEDADGVRDSGAVYLHLVQSGRTMAKPIKITQESAGVPGSSEPGDLFGWSVALGHFGGDPDALDLAIGAPYEDNDGAGEQAAGGGRDAGAVTVLYDVTKGKGTYRGVRWDLADVVAGAHLGARFGYSLAAGEWRGTSHLAVGAPGADVDGAAGAGLVQLFASDADATEPRPVRSLRQGAGGLPDAAEPGDGFGHSLAFAGGHLLVGSPFEAVGKVPEAGAVTVVPLDGSPGSFVTEGRVRVQAYDHFGWSVTGVGDAWLAVGAPDEQATHGGAVALIPIPGGDAHLLAPGYKGVPQLPRHTAGRIRPQQATGSVDFGAVVAG